MTSTSLRSSNAYVGPRTSTPAHFAGGIGAAQPLAPALDDVAEEEVGDSVAHGVLWHFDDGDDVRSRHPEHIDVVSQVYNSL